MAIVVVDHSAKVAMSLADRIYLVGTAHVAFNGTGEELNARPEIRARYLQVECLAQRPGKQPGLRLGARR